MEKKPCKNNKQKNPPENKKTQGWDMSYQN